MKIQLLYFPECPSFQDAFSRIQKVLQEEGIITNVQCIVLNSDADAQMWHFRGSPTILVNGEDVDAGNETDQPYSLNCRIYQREDGRYSPLPSEEMIRRALNKAHAHDA